MSGRIAILKLPPFNIAEAESGHQAPLSSISEKRDLWIKSYIQSSIESDVRQLENIRDFRAFEMFVQMSAAHRAQEFHPATPARNCGVTQPTIKPWAKTLEISYRAIVLPPLFLFRGRRWVGFRGRTEPTN
jgi:predicted AAA+ superfamily ATPase